MIDPGVQARDTRMNTEEIHNHRDFYGQTGSQEGQLSWGIRRFGDLVPDTSKNLEVDKNLHNKSLEDCH